MTDRKPARTTRSQDHGDPRDELVDHLPALRAFALSLTREGASADDLVQDTIVKAWTHIDKFQPGTNLRAWLFTILRNTFYSARRKTKREVSDSDGIHAARQATRPEHDGRLALNDFRTAFEQLPDEQREALKETPSNTKISEYVLVLAHDPQALTLRTPLFNGIMYDPGGLSRAERELGAVAASFVNRCI